MDKAKLRKQFMQFDPEIREAIVRSFKKVADDLADPHSALSGALKNLVRFGRDKDYRERVIREAREHVARRKRDG